MWVRGLKPIVRSWRSISTVAPYVGAWIETRLHPASTIPYHVAPYVGAWIETRGDNNGVVKVVESHPMWVRGLKQKAYDLTDAQIGRTLCGCVD